MGLTKNIRPICH